MTKWMSEIYQSFSINITQLSFYELFYEIQNKGQLFWSLYPLLTTKKQWLTNDIFLKSDLSVDNFQWSISSEQIHCYISLTPIDLLFLFFFSFFFFFSKQQKCILLIFNMDTIIFIWILFFFSFYNIIAQSAGAVEYTDCTSAEE